MNIREEIYQKLDKMIQKRLDDVRNDYEFGSIEKTEFERISDEIEQEYNAYLLEMALASDSEVKEKMAFILDFKTNTRKIKGL
jgi:hypothetical protein